MSGHAPCRAVPGGGIAISMQGGHVDRHSSPRYRVAVQSKLADYAEQALIDAARQLTYEQRLAAFFEHSRLMTGLFLAGQRIRSDSAKPGPKDQQR